MTHSGLASFKALEERSMRSGPVVRAAVDPTPDLLLTPEGVDGEGSRRGCRGQMGVSLGLVSAPATLQIAARDDVRRIIEETHELIAVLKPQVATVASRSTGTL